jgi:DevC protein
MPGIPCTPPLGWLQLWHKPVRLAVAVAGIAFAVLLILMQLGFRSALFESTLRFHERFRYDIALFSPDSVFIVRPAAFSIRRLYQALGADAVEDVSPVYIFPAVWKNPWGTDRRASQSMGVDPGKDQFETPGFSEGLALLRQPGDLSRLREAGRAIDAAVAIAPATSRRASASRPSNGSSSNSSRRRHTSARATSARRNCP